MTIDAPEHRFTLLDRLFLFRHRPIKAYRIGGNCALFLCASEKRKVVLKFWHPGNVQYHPMAPEDASKLGSSLLAVSEGRG